MTDGAPATVFVSIATPSHFAFATVALGSVVSQGGPRCILYLVGSGPLFTKSDCLNVEIRHVEDHIDRTVIRQLVTRYTPSEVCFALKPFVMSGLLEEGISCVHYIDSDIKFFSDAGQLDNAFSGKDILLTPHYLQPFPDDGFKPGVLTLLRGGVFNAGYVGVRNTQTALRFLRWWGKSVLRHGKNEPRNGTCGDQRWLDLVPALFPSCRIWRHPGANVAYWNLHERNLSLNNGVFECNGSSLLFFHFSGFDPDTPTRLSRYQNRVSINTEELLMELLSQYAREIQIAKNRRHNSSPYAYGRWWHSNRPVVRTLRDWLRKNW